MRHIVLPFLVAAFATPFACAQEAPNASATAAKPVDFETLVVHGVQPGPGLWKVSKGDHVLWVLGTLRPLPKHITWNAHRVESVVTASQEVINEPQVAVNTHVGFFGLGIVMLLPSLIGLRDNPDGATLQDVVPGPLYARWVPLKQRYIGGGGKVDHWRPIFAALDLYAAAIGKSGLSDKLIAESAVAKAAKHAHIKVTTPRVTITINDPKALAREFKTSPLDDLDCFRKTLDRIDGDLGTMAARANAWSTGDLDALRRLPATDQMTACATALSEAQFSRERGGGDLTSRADAAWIDAATKALAANRSTVALLPIGNLLKPGGYLSRLRALGYVVEEPASVAQPAVSMPAPVASGGG